MGTTAETTPSVTEPGSGYADGSRCVYRVVQRDTQVCLLLVGQTSDGHHHNAPGGCLQFSGRSWIVARARMAMRGTLTVLATATLLLLAAPLAAEAQQPGRVFRIGILSNVPLSDPEGARVWGAFIQGLRELGYVEGRNLTIEHLSSEGHYERLPELAAELVRRKVDVIVAPATQNVAVAKRASQTIPIVMAGSGDAVGAGLVASLARPGGNVTGLSMLGDQIVPKQLELLKQVVPKMSRLAALGNPTNAGYALWMGQVKSAARTLGLRLQIVDVTRSDDFDNAFAAMTREHADAVFVAGDGLFILQRARIAELAAKHRIPGMYGLRELVDAGGLMVYGPSMKDGFQRAATFVDKILKGAKPGDLPVEQPTKFELVINLRTAKAIGLTIPPSLLQRADQIID